MDFHIVSFSPAPCGMDFCPGESGREELIKTTGKALLSTALKAAGMDVDTSDVGFSSLGHEGRNGRFGFDRVHPVCLHETSVVGHSQGFGLDPKIELVSSTCPEASTRSQKDECFHALQGGVTVEAPEENNE